MINKIFVYDNLRNRVELNTPEILLIKEFSELLKPSRNQCKEDKTGELGLRAFREFTYIWLALSWDSIYSDYEELERHKESLKDAGLTEEEFNNPEFRVACRKYREILESNRSIKLLHAAQNTVDNFIDYFNTIVDLSAVDINGKPIYKTKDVMAEISSLHKVHEELQILEHQVKKEISETSSIRGGAIEDFDPGEF